jgi:hypothetical protein
MPIFYTETGSLSRLEVSGSTLISGSGSGILIISGSTGSLIFSDITSTGELFTVASASIDVFSVIGKTVRISGSLVVTGSITGSLLGTASFATTASHALNAGGAGAAFPFSGSAIITGSLLISSSAATSNLRIIGSSSILEITGSRGPIILVTDNMLQVSGSAITSPQLRVTGTASIVEISGSQGGIFTIFDTPNRVNINGAVSASSFTGSLSGSVTGSLFGTSSWAISASQAVTSSYVLNAVSSSFAATASLLLGSVVSASFASTASIVTTPYFVTQSKGGLLYNPSGLSAGDTGSLVVWRAPYPCTASTIYAYREGGTTAAVSASRNGLALTTTNLTLTNALQYFSASATQNQNFNAGDRLELALISFSGTVTEINIQVDFRP